MKKYISAVSSRIPTSWMDNKLIATVVLMLLAIYAALAAPSLPASVIRFFDQWYGKLIFIFLIAFLSVKNIQVALMVAVVFLIILHYAAQLDIQEHFFGACNKREGFTDGVSEDVSEVLEKVGVPVEKKTEGVPTDNPTQMLQNTMNTIQQLTQLQNQAKGEMGEITASVEADNKTEPSKMAEKPAETAPTMEKFQTMNSHGMLEVSPYDGIEDGAPFDM